MSKKIENTESHKNDMKVENTFVFGKENYILMLIGLGLIVLGFVLMSGSPDSDIFSFRKITLAPLLVLGGFVVEIFAIFRKTKD